MRRYKLLLLPALAVSFYCSSHLYAAGQWKIIRTNYYLAVQEQRAVEFTPPPADDSKEGLSYPSGHATISRIEALVLADLVPARRAELLARADEIALSRVIGGVHHPSDIEAGKRLAETLYAVYRKSPAFRRELETLRGCLILPKHAPLATITNSIGH